MDHYTVKLYNKTFGEKLPDSILGYHRLEDFITSALNEINDSRGRPYKVIYEFDLERYINLGKYLWVCYKNGMPKGFILGVKGPSSLSPNTEILVTDVLYAIPGTRAAYHLVHTFLDFGKHNADHVVIGLNVDSNLKPESLEKLGFEMVEAAFVWRNK